LRGFLFLGVNYLAHIYLSRDHQEELLGNFIADAVKGRQFYDYPEAVKQGILLHRFIDDYTDTHPIVLETKILFRPIYHKLSPILVDILYDHFLAKNWLYYHEVPLRQFVDQAYNFLEQRKAEMPERIKAMLPYMIEHDWLFNYQYKEGIERTLLGMSKRVRGGEVLKFGWRDLEPVYEVVQDHFKEFMQAIDGAVTEWRQDYIK